MFEDSLIESRSSQISSTKPWTALTSLILQFAIATVIVTIPLLHPAPLSFRIDAPKVLLPPPPRPPVPAARVERAASAVSALPAPIRNQISLPSLLSHPGEAANEAPPPTVIGGGMGTQAGLPAGISDNSAAHGPVVSLTPAPTPRGPVSVSSGVSQGMLLAPIQPIYPAIAKAAHVQGRVVVQATISATGGIESLHVLSGPAMLQPAALEAIRAARYQPYRLNGQPTAVMTTITVNFTLGA